MPQPAQQAPQEIPQSPETSPSERSEPGATGSGRASSPDSFLADAGPAFDPARAPDAPLLDEPGGELALAEPEGWEEQTIQDLLVTQGNVTNWVLRLDANDDTWKHTQDDLRSIARPLTRILNRYDATRAAAAAGDEIALVAAVSAYGARNYTHRRRLLAQIAARQPEPITGVPADEDLGPEHDAAYQHVHQAPPALRPKGVR